MFTGSVVISFFVGKDNVQGADLLKDVLNYKMIFASILLFEDRVIMDGVKSNTGDKGRHKF